MCMDMILTIVYIVVGAALVLWGADRLTGGASALARRFDVSELVVGLTVVAMGTSLPELVTSLTSILKGSSDISLGNIVGSNIFNVLMIVGCAALARPITVSRTTVTKDIPFALLSVLILWVVTADSLLDGAGVPNLLSRSDGLVLLGFFAVFMAYTFSVARNYKLSANGCDDVVVAAPTAPMPYWKITLYIIIGIAGLVLGGNLFVDGAVCVARELGVSESIIGLTLVSAGTSLPELATSVVAARKGSSSMAIGNVVGSTIFNVFFVMGICSTLAPIAVGNISMVDMLVMLVSCLILWLFSATRYEVQRWEGAVMTLLYVGYTAFLIWRE